MTEHQSEKNKAKHQLSPLLRNILYFLLIWVGVPFVAQLVFLGVISELDNEWLAFALMCLTPIILGFLFRFDQKRLPLSDQNFLQRYKVEVAVILSILFICCIALLLHGIPDDLYTRKGMNSIGYLALAPFLILLLMKAFGSSLFIVIFVPVICYSTYLLGVILKTWYLGCLKIKLNGLLLTLVIAAILSGVCAWRINEQNSIFISEKEKNTASVDAGVDETLNGSELDYRPFAGNDDLLTQPRGDIQLRIDADFPRLDGRTALYPIYASAAQAIYAPPAPGVERLALINMITRNRTSKAYENLINGETDLIFVAAPSDEQIQAAKEKGLHFTFTPIGREAFVFLVNEKNPIQSLTVEQIRDIYAGKVNNWSEVGGASSVIRAFQRHDGSGSQTALLDQVMQGAPVREPLREETYRGIGGRRIHVANYRNTENAIGYSFRFYATGINQVDDVKMLAVNGVEPTRENIRNGIYPFTADFYMVTARPVSENTQKLMDWFVSEQGQKLIDDVGYVPLFDND